MRHHREGLRLLFRADAEYAEKARAISAMTRDVSELMTEIGLKPPVIETGQRVAYHSACSLQHGQGVRRQPQDLLKAAGFDVIAIPEQHICCGSAGNYNILQPEIAAQLRTAKLQTSRALALILLPPATSAA